MDVTTYGYKIPRTPDTGETFFPALEFDLQRLNDHTHNGQDSAPLSQDALPATTQTILNTAWGSDLGGGTYKQTKTLPSVGTIPTQLSYDSIGVEIRVTSTGERVYPKIVKSSAHAYDIYTNDPAQNFTAVYTS